jgi:hypothetical protein
MATIPTKSKSKPKTQDSKPSKRLSTRSAKAKGRRLQDYLKEQLHITFPQIPQEDIKTAIMGETGLDIRLSSMAKQIIPVGFECKNVEKLNIWKAIEQATEAVDKDGSNLQPCVVFKKNRSKTYACIELDFFLYLLSNKTQ